MKELTIVISSCKGRWEVKRIITIVLSDKTYENDVYPLFKAFFPLEVIKVYSKEEDTKAEDFKIVKSKEVASQIIQLTILEDKLIIEGSSSGIQTADYEIPAGLPKPLYKNALKRILYTVLSDYCKKTLPWGILTGIRPTKLVYEMLDQELSESDILDKMQKEYLCSITKTKLSIQIAKRERQLLKEMDYQNGYSIYIGIPFCPTTCLYCSFTSYSAVKFANLIEDYLNALEKEIRYAATCLLNKKLTTVYIGGGTPTTLSADQLERLLKLVKTSFNFTQVKEFCVEAGRPDSITREKLQVLKDYGVDRISINPQSMQQRTLDIIGRQHSIEEVRHAFSLAREVGHSNINMDIIIGLPGENPEDVTDTLRQIRELNPEGLTVHTLALKRAARLNTEKENYSELKATDVPFMLEKTVEHTTENGYYPYYLYRQKNMEENLENTGYSKYGKEGLYNILIMEEKQTILALGAGAMSKFVFHAENRIERVDNVKSVTDYISRIDEMISRKQKFLENNEELL